MNKIKCNIQKKKIILNQSATYEKIQRATKEIIRNVFFRPVYVGWGDFIIFISSDAEIPEKGRGVD